MKQFKQSGYIDGKFEKSLPFFMYAQNNNICAFNNIKRDMNNSGIFNINISNVDASRLMSFRGLIFPIHLSNKGDKKDFFLKFQRFLKKVKKQRNFITLVNGYLEKNGYEYLKLNPNKTSRSSYLIFEIDQKVYLELLKDLYYMTKILDAKNEVLEIQEVKKFDVKSYTEFLEEVYTKVKLLKYDIFPFELVYIYENVIGHGKNMFEYNEELKPYKLSRYNFQKYFQPKKDIQISKLNKIEFEIIEYGWIDLKLKFDDNEELVINCSSVYDPFLNIYKWLELIKYDNQNHILEIDEERSVATFEVFCFDEYLYLTFFYRWEKDTIFEGVLKRDEFIDYFFNSLKSFIQKNFAKYDDDYFWQDDIQLLKSKFTKE